MDGFDLRYGFIFEICFTVIVLACIAKYTLLRWQKKNIADAKEKRDAEHRNKKEDEDRYINNAAVKNKYDFILKLIELTKDMKGVLK